MDVIVMDKLEDMQSVIEYNGGGISTLLTDTTTLKNAATTLQNDATVLKNKGVIKSVQRGFHGYHYNNQSSHTIQISEIDPSKSFLFMIAPGYTTRFSWTLNSTNIQFNNHGTQGESDIAWEIVEFY